MGTSHVFFVFLPPICLNNNKKQKYMAVELKGLTKRSENYSQWYNELVVKADLAEQSPVR